MPINHQALRRDFDARVRDNRADLFFEDMRLALEQARDWGADEMQLSVYADNPQAQAFYRRFGLEKVADIEFWVGDHCDPEFMFARAI